MHTSEGKINAETYDCLTTLPPVLNVLEATVNNGAVKGGTYIIGPEESPVVTITPWLHLPEIIEKSNPGASRENFWTFFFPDMFPVWDSWIAENSAIEKTNTITIFKPWWDKDRTRNYGAVAMDYSIENINNSVSNVKIRNSGFAFIILGNGDILGVTPDAIDILELSPHVFEKNTADYISLNLGSSSNYAIHIDVISDDHIGDLAHSFNHMALEVKESYKKLERHASNLEIEVEKRTKELAEMNKELHQLSITDKLTGLNNRIKLDETLDTEFERSNRFEHPLSWRISTTLKESTMAMVISPVMMY